MAFSHHESGSNGGVNNLDSQPVKMPAVFFGHGNPMNAIERNRYSQAWRAFGRSIPKPRAIVAISAHWYIRATAVTAMPWPKTIHDFYGFPEALHRVEYKAPGDPDLARTLQALIKPTTVELDVGDWGLDHGTWSVLTHVVPNADVPVVQLSIDLTKPAEYHLDLGRRLDALRDQGVLVLGSGNIVQVWHDDNRDGRADYVEIYRNGQRVQVIR